ncbi:response regulator [Thiospirochaeta perfilievii]|uniref:Response regulator n=1 Tax=Thiospirochaeta perfilievii TaxID=252967 RepID=A0A5C1QDY2_9SPIO|nr:response regulator [Thiospirochaeta perfilievii]QEN04856.1 response regulator [Thiospirochaeta perfilievii]
MDILIADDSKTSRNLLKGILKRLNFNVIEAINGEEAWEKLQVDNPPRIALLDWIMPKISGIDLVKKIRKKRKSLETILI